MKKRLMGLLMCIVLVLSMVSCSTVESALRTVSLSEREWTKIDTTFEEKDVEKIVVSNLSFIDISNKNLKFVYSENVRVVGKYSKDLETKHGFSVNISNGKMTIGTTKFLNAKVSSFELTVYAPFKSVEVQGAYNIDFDCTGADSLKLRLSGSSRVNMPALELASLNIDVAGACSLSLDGTVTTFDCSLSGASNITGDMFHTKETRVVVAGVGNVSLKSGSASFFDVSLMGSGSLSADNFFADRVRVSLSGTAHATVYAENELDITINGFGKVGYRGTPSLKQTINGSGSVTQIAPSETDAETTAS